MIMCRGSLKTPEITAYWYFHANEVYQDNTRKELNHHVLIDMLGLPESILGPLDLLRLKWCSEPSVHGEKKAAPGVLPA